jgi:hypothetical protein
MHEGKVVIIADDGVLIGSLEVRSERGPPCNVTRDFHVIDANRNTEFVMHITDSFIL